jgi:hypothetical protein
MSRTEGNEALCAIEPVRTNDGVRWVPFLSGNAIRHRCVRAPGARHLVERMGLKGELSLEQLNFLLHGGNLTESTGRENTARIAEMYRLFPLFRLLGGCLPDQVLSGSLHVWRGTLLCRENEAQLRMLLPPGFDTDGVTFHPAHAYISGYQYTRSDAEKSAGDLLPAGAEKDKSSLMIFSGQAVMRGAMFLHGFTLLHPSPLELGALLHSLLLWANAGGTIGGQAARGHGRLKTVLLGHDETRADAVAAYLAHVEEHRDECRQWLTDAFYRAPKKGKKGSAQEALLG